MEAVTRVQDRTRRGIVTAAIDLLAADRSATLAQIADAAGVGRSTLHRYFADRAELVGAVDQECQRRFAEAAVRARPADGPGLVALQRLWVEFLGLGSCLALIFADNAPIDPDSWSDDAEDEIAAIVGRGQRDGTIDPSLPVGWIETVSWMLLFSAWLYETTTQASRHESSTLLARTLAGAVGRAGSQGPS